MKRIPLILLAEFAMLLSACMSVPLAPPTPTQTSTLTATPRPTSTATATFTPTSEPTQALGKRVEAPEGGYSFQEPVGYEVHVDGEQVGVLDKEGTVIISLYGGVYDPNAITPDDIIEEFVSEVFKRGEGDYEKGESYPIVIDGVEGIAYDMTGTLFGSPLKGQTFLVLPREDQYLFGHCEYEQRYKHVGKQRVHRF